MSDSTSLDKFSFCIVCGGIGFHYSFCTEITNFSSEDKTDPEVIIYDQTKMVELLEKLTHLIEVEKEMLKRVEELLQKIVETLKV